MEKTFLRYLWKYSRKQQIVILLITSLSFPILYFSLELPKRIVNNAIHGTIFPVQYGPFILDQEAYLLALCLSFLGLVIANNAIKYTLNVYRGLTGERVLWRLRYTLYQKLLQFPLIRFQHLSSGEIVSMITAEIEDLGGFAGSLLATPAFQGGTLCVYLFFIFMQNALLGLAAIALYPAQIYIIPKLQRQISLLIRKRIAKLRQMSQDIDESLQGMTEIHSCDMHNWHLWSLSKSLQDIFRIRYAIYQKKYTIKFLNNFMNQLTPFMFYLIGGYFVIKGAMSLGSLLAVIAAYKDLASPWRELLNFYQSFSTVELKYKTAIEHFVLPEEHRETESSGKEAYSLSGNITFSDVQFDFGAGTHDTAPLTLCLAEKEEVVLIGNDHSGRREILQMAAGLIPPISGQVRMGDMILYACPKKMISQKIAYIGATPYLLTGTIRDNLFYGLTSFTHSVQKQARLPKDASFSRWSFFPKEPRIRAHPPEETCLEDTDALEERALVLARKLSFSKYLYDMGLHTRFERAPTTAQERKICDGILTIRRKIFEKAQQKGASLLESIDFWDISTFNHNASLAENLLYAVPTPPGFAVEKILEEPEIFSFLTETGLASLLTKTGKHLARGSGAPPKDRALKYMALALHFVPAHQSFPVLSSQERDKIVAARSFFHEMIKQKKIPFARLDREHFNPFLSLGENSFFGHIRKKCPHAHQKSEHFLHRMICREGLEDSILRFGLDFHVGHSGALLSNFQHQKIALIRAFLRTPDVFILDDVATGSGAESASLRAAIRMLCQGRTLVFGTSNPAFAAEFRRTIFIDNGEIVEKGH